MARNAVASIDETLGSKCRTDRRQPAEKSKTLLASLPFSVTTTSRRRRRPGLAVVGDHRALERAVERRQHAALGEIERRRLAVARARQIDRDLLGDAAGMRPHHHDAVGQHDRLLDVVGDHDQRRLRVGPQVEQVILQVDAGEGIERRERLVEQQHLRPRHQRARDRDALRLAAGQFARPDARLVGQADAVERARDARIALRLRAVLEAEADIVGDGEPRQQARLLEDDADLLVRRGDRHAVEHDLALGRRVEAGDGAQQRGLAAARAADHHDDLARRDVERDAVERAHAVGIGLADAVEHEHGVLTPARSDLPSAGTAPTAARSASR